MTAPDDPEVLRKEILIMLKKISDRGSLLFFQWLLSFRKLEARRSCSGEPCPFPRNPDGNYGRTWRQKP